MTQDNIVQKEISVYIGDGPAKGQDRGGHSLRAPSTYYSSSELYQLFKKVHVHDSRPFSVILWYRMLYVCLPQKAATSRFTAFFLHKRTPYSHQIDRYNWFNSYRWFRFVICYRGKCRICTKTSHFCGQEGSKAQYDKRYE